MSMFNVGDRVQLLSEPDDNDLPGVVRRIGAGGRVFVQWEYEDGAFDEDDSDIRQQCDLRILPPLAEPIIHDSVNHPSHYISHPSGIECIQVTEHMGFNLGNATKYVWRADLKENALEDLRKAVWYIQREIALREIKVAA